MELKMPFQKLKYAENKILLKITDDHREIYEPLTRKIGGVWSPNLSGWIFDANEETKINDFLVTQVETEIEEKCYDDYKIFAREPSCMGNTPNTTSSANSDYYDIIQELVDRVSDLEKVVEDMQKKLQRFSK